MLKHIFIFRINKQTKELHKDMVRESPSIPDYSTISRRINMLNIKMENNKSKDFEDEYIIIAIESTGIKVTNRGQ